MVNSVFGLIFVWYDTVYSNLPSMHMLVILYRKSIKQCPFNCLGPIFGYSALHVGGFLSANSVNLFAIHVDVKVWKLIQMQSKYSSTSFPFLLLLLHILEAKVVILFFFFSSMQLFANWCITFTLSTDNKNVIVFSSDSNNLFFAISPYHFINPEVI